MAEPKTWRFEQLGGAKAVLELTGWAAPLGRPRKGAVVRDGIQIRKAEIYYSGNNEGPTRHVFGDKMMPWELKCRFRDRAGGKGFAKAKVEEVKRFVAGKQRVRITWGDIIAAIGFIEEFDPGRESEGEVEATIRIAIDVDLNLVKPKQRKIQPLIPADFAEKFMIAELSVLGASIPHIPSVEDVFQALDSLLSLPGNIASDALDAFDSAVSLVTGAAGAFKKAADGIRNLEQATFAELNRLNAASSQLKGAVIALRETFTNANSDATLLQDRATDNARLWKNQTTAEQSVRLIVSELSRLERAVRIAARGLHTKTYQAKQGDTWESISTAAYGSPDRAADIRAANKIPTGQNPIPGNTYTLPE